jgi:HK97 family phage major capsid protein
MNKIFQLQQKRAQTLATATELLDRGLNTAEDKERYRSLLADADTAQSDIDSLQAIERALGGGSVSPAKSTAPAAPAIVTTRTEHSADEKATRRAKLNAAWRHILRNGYDPNDRQYRDLVTTSSTTGAPLVPQEFQSVFTEAEKFIGSLASLVTRHDQETGRPVRFPIVDDTGSSSTMSYLTESSSSTGLEADPTLSSVVTGTDTLVTQIRYSWQELSDAFDLESFLRRIAAVRVARAVNYALSTGTDNGTSTALPNSPTGGLLGSVSAVVNQGALANGITYANLAVLAGSVDHQYYLNGGFMGSPSVFNYLLQQVDTTGKPLYPIVDGVMQVAGKPFYPNAAMPAYNTASSNVVLFGDFSKQYGAVFDGGVSVKITNERYAELLEGAMIVYTRVGATNLLSNAVAAFKTAAS